jgi:hypothetical protein
MGKYPYLLGLILLAFTSSYALSDELRVNSLDERLDDIELKYLLKKFSISGQVINHFEHLNYENTESGTVTNTLLTPIGMRVGINIDFTVSNQVQFYSTLGMSKVWNFSGREPNEVGDGPQYTSMKGGYAYKNSQAYFDTAYIRYHDQNSPWSFVMGRLTTNGGPPIEQLDGVARNGTYPRFAYNAIFDGVALIYDLSSMLPKNHRLKLRAFHTPFSIVDSDNKDKQKTETTANDAKIESSEPQSALLTEYSLLNSAVAKSVDIYHMIWNYEGFYEKDYQDSSEAGIEKSSATNNTLYFGLKGFMGSNLNLNYTYYTFNERFGGEEASSYNYFINLNYKFKNNINTNHIIGFEYINTDDAFYLEDHNSLYFSNFYTRHSNNGYHLFYTIPVGIHQAVRMGYFNYKGGITDWNEEYIDTKTEAIYSRWKVFF